MPDICDHANDEMEFLNQIKFSRPPSPTQPSATHCCDWGPLGIRKLSYVKLFKLNG